MAGKITITNQSPKVSVIDIEGVIGVPEQWQFEEPGQRVATYETFRAVVESLKEINAPQVVVNIRSSGGNVNDALLIFDALSELNAKITTKCFGYVASAATIIAQAASEGRREISKNALYLIHKSVCAVEGNANEIKRSLDTLKTTDDRIAGIYAHRSARAEQGFVELMSENNGDGRWLSPEEAVECGLVDKVKGKGDTPQNVEEVVSNYGLPPIPQEVIAKAEKYKNRRKMIDNVSKQWNAILESIGLAANEEAGSEEIVDQEPQKKEEPQKIENNKEQIQSVERSEAVSDVVVARAEAHMIDAHMTEVADLRNKISLLESQNARLAVSPTTTTPKEDPSAYEAKLSPNEEAYYEDLRNFK